MGNKKTKPTHGKEEESEQKNLETKSPRFQSIAQEFMPIFEGVIAQQAALEEDFSLSSPLVPLPSCFNLCPPEEPNNPNLENHTTPLMLKQSPVFLNKTPVAGQSISTYPPEVAGHLTMSDFFKLSLFPGGACIAVADGCNWGNRPRVAAITACKSFCSNLSAELHSISSLRDCYDALLGSLVFAQYKIMNLDTDMWNIGCTTLLGGLLFPTKKSSVDVRLLTETNDLGVLSSIPNDSLSHIVSQMSHWDIKSLSQTSKTWNQAIRTSYIRTYCFASVVVGDVRGFLYKKSEKKVVPVIIPPTLSCSNNDCQGRLGPHQAGGKADLRNLCLNHVICQTGDLILVLSDGVYENLHPQDVSDAFPILDQAQDSARENMIHICQRLAEVCIEFENAPAITKKLLELSLEATVQGRDFAINHPTHPVSFPGRMDHSTCLAYEIL